MFNCFAFGTTCQKGRRSSSDAVPRPSGKRVLVDLVRFELTTSSMPFKKYQSLAGVFARNKRLSTRPRGLRWTPRGGFWASGLHSDSGTPRTGWHVACFRARAVAGCSICCLPKETTINFHIRTMPMWSGDRHRDCDVSCGLPVREWSKLLQKSIRWLSGHKREISQPLREDD